MREIILFLLILTVGTIYGHPAGTVENNSIISEYKTDSLKRQSANNLYATVGFYIVEASVSVNYERMMLHFGKNSSTCLYGRAAYGYWADWTSGGPGGILSTNLIFLKKVNHIEAGFGAVALYNRKDYKLALNHSQTVNESAPEKMDYIIFNPLINFGYRYQNPENHLMFRIGFGYPEGPYLGLGFNF